MKMDTKEKVERSDRILKAIEAWFKKYAVLGNEQYKTIISMEALFFEGKTGKRTNEPVSEFIKKSRKKPELWADKHKIGVSAKYGHTSVWREDVERIEKLLEAPNMRMTTKTLMKGTSLSESSVHKTLDWMKSNGRVAVSKGDAYTKFYYRPEGARQATA